MIYDIIIIGGGPAGLTAAVYARRANKSVLVIEKGAFGGQITYSPKVENIPGFTALSGNEFAERLVDQAIAQDVAFESDQVMSLRKGTDGIWTVVTESGEYESRTVILATGAKHRLMGVPGEQDFIGEGISFCAVCDGAFYKNRTVGVVGGGNSALQEALLLSDLASQVYVIQNLDDLTGEEQLRRQIYEKKNISVMTGTVVDRVLGEGRFAGVRLRREKDGNMTELTLDGLFVAIGLVPQNQAFEEWVTLDGRGYAVADENCLTRTEGLFVAGDCRTKKVRQVTTAVADGAVAALNACEYLDKR